MTTQTDATVIRCPHCHKRNRVRPTGEGIPRCANCHHPLPWVAGAGQAGAVPEARLAGWIEPFLPAEHNG